MPWAQAPAGAVATQSFANTSYGPRGLALMSKQISAREALDQLLKDDEGGQLRQVGMVDGKGNSATHTGAGCFPWAGGRAGPGYAIQGNVLKGERVVSSMESVFLRTGGDLPNRLFRALLAGDRAGGDRRGRQSAAILVVKSGAGYGGFNDRWLDYRVDDHEDPVKRLGELIELHRLYFGRSPVKDRVLIKGQALLRLQKILHSLHYLDQDISGAYDPVTRSALEAFLGNENFEERADLSIGWIDRPVLRFLFLKYERSDADKH